MTCSYAPKFSELIFLFDRSVFGLLQSVIGNAGAWQVELKRLFSEGVQSFFRSIMISNSAASAEWRKRMCHASELPESKRNRSSTPHSPSTASTPVKSGVVKISGPAAGCSGNSASAPSSIVDCVLVVLGECEQQMRSMRSLCNAESEAFNGNCGAVLEDIMALQFRASEIIRARQGTTRDPPLAHSAACIERGAWQHVGDANLLADICWFRQVAKAISKTKHLITNYKEALLCIKTLKQKDAAREDDTSERQGEGRALTRGGDKQNGLMAVMQRLGSVSHFLYYL